MGTGVRAEVRLRLLTPAESVAIDAGGGGPLPPLRWHPEYPTSDTLIAVALSWWLWQILDDDVVVGDICCHAARSESLPSSVEIGYQVVPSRRGEGIATQACRLLLDDLWRVGVDQVTAAASADNPASRIVLGRAGFRPAGGDLFAAVRL